MNILLDKYFESNGVILRLIKESDAQFIFELRTDQKLGQHLSITPPKVEDQINWIKNYKEREAKEKEFYFIFEDSAHERWGTMRLYCITDESFTVGSWICLPNNYENIAIKSWLLLVELGFKKFGVNICLFDVRKKNKSVLYFVYLFRPVIINEDDLNYYFSLDKNTFYENRQKVISFLKIKL